MKHAGFLIGFIFVSAAANAQPLDCDHLIHSKVPFQIARTGSKSSVAQVYRSDNLMATTYTSNNPGINKSVMKGALVISSVAPNGKHLSYSYDSTPNGFYFESTRHIAQIVHIEDFASKPSRLDIEPLTDEDLSVGPCIIHVAHYRIRYPDNVTGVQSSDIWFSRDLLVAIKSKSVDKDKEGKEHVRAIESTDLATDFQPMQ